MCEVCPRGVMAKALDYRIDVSHAITVIFGQIPVGKVLTPLSTQA